MSRNLLLGKCNQFCLGSQYPFLPGDIRYHDFAPCFIRDADNPGFGHRRVLVENGFYFLRRNVGAASDDEFLLTPGEPVLACGILLDEIPGIKPPLAKDLGGSLRIVPVAGRISRTLNRQLAHFSGLHFVAVRIHHTQQDAL